MNWMHKIEYLIIIYIINECIKSYCNIQHMMNLLVYQESAAHCCEAICRAMIKNKDDWKIGKTKVFLKVLFFKYIATLRNHYVKSAFDRSFPLYSSRRMIMTPTWN